MGQVIKYLIGLILIGLPSYLIRFSIAGIPTTALEIAIYITVICYLLSVYFGKAKLHVPDRRFLLPIGLMVAGALIGTLISPDKRLALGQLKGFFLDPLLFGLVVYSALRSKLVNRDWIVYSLIIGGILVAIGSFAFPEDPQGRALSVFAFETNPNANYLAIFLVPIVALAAAKFKWQWVTLGGLILIAILGAESRGGLLGVGGAVFYLLHQKYQRHRQMIIGFALAFLLSVAYFAKPDLKATPDSGRVSSSNNIRYEIWKTTGEMLTKDTRNFVFGVGLGNYQHYFTQLTKDRVNYPEFIAPRALTPHNIFLAMWVNGGLLTLVGFVWLIGAAFRSGTFLPVHAALVALIGHGLVDTPYFKNDLSVLFWTLISLL